MTSCVAHNAGTKDIVNTFVSSSLYRTFDPSDNFQALCRAGSSLSSLHGLPQPNNVAESLQLLLTTCMQHGQTSFIVDYIQSVCADPKLASTNLEQSAVLEGAVAHRWLQQLATGLQRDLEGLSAVQDPQVLARLQCCAASAQLVNHAISTAGLNVNAGVNPGGSPACFSVVGSSLHAAACMPQLLCSRWKCCALCLQQIPF